MLMGVLASAHDAAPVPVETILDTYLTSYQRVVTSHLSTLHWGRHVSIYLSDRSERYRDNTRRGVRERAGDEVDAFTAYDPGTVVVKEQRLMPGGAIDGWSIMVRGSSSKGLGGPWRFIEVDAKRRVLLDGHGSDPMVAVRCAGCHQQIAARDFVFHSVIDEAPQPQGDEP
jgi:hypothetical protein